MSCSYALRLGAGSLFAFLIFPLVFFECTVKTAPDTAFAVKAPETDAPVLTEPDADETPARARAARIARALDNRLLAAQVIVSGVDGREHLTGVMRVLLEECPSGGIMLFRYNLNTGNKGVQNLTEEISAFIRAQTVFSLSDSKESPSGDSGAEEKIAGTEEKAPGIPPFIAVDHEGGNVSRFMPGVAVLPPAASYWELAQNAGWERAAAQIEEDSFRAGVEIKTLGINVNFAPVAETLGGGNRDFLHNRSFGPDPSFTAEAAAAFIRGMERAGLLCVAKHFPGSAGPDPHRFPSVMDCGLDELSGLIAPFAALIKKGQGRALMAAHTLVPAIDSSNIASCSALVMNDWLRAELDFKGIIFCDDFSMVAASNPAAAISPAASVPAISPAGGGPGIRPEQAAVKALAAGADMVLVWPPDIRRTHRAIQAALADGSLSVERLREAAARIIFEKIQMGLIDGE
jgi:beta-N-acetylhexosaminidase